MKMTAQMANDSNKNQLSAECHAEAPPGATTKTKLLFRYRRGLGFVLTNSAFISFLLLASAHAATPPGGAISTTAKSVSWQGHFYTAAALADSSQCPPASLDPSTICDHFTLTVNVDPSYWDTHIGGAEVTITWASSDNDFDMYIYDRNGNIVASSAAGGTTFERTVIMAASGTYDVVVVPFTVVQSGYQGTAQLISQKLPKAPGGGPAAYNGTFVSGPNPANAPQNKSLPLKNQNALVLQVHDVGHDAAEPTLGVDRSGAIFYAAAAFDGINGNAKTTVLRSTDGGLTWQNVSPSVANTQTMPFTLDPYLYVDPIGRVYTVDSLLVGGDYLSFSDDQGASWTTSAVVIPGVNDHQTFCTGVTPIGNQALLPIDPSFPKICYYCVNQVADSWCARSLDGGRTFAQTATPAYLGVDPAAGGFCGGLHGHVKADPQGRIFLPKSHCGYPWLAISDNGGDIWTRVELSTQIGAAGDPALASDTAGNLYYVWWDWIHHLPYLSISRDHGATWTTPLMFSPPGVFEVNFPTITAGDPGKIAITFPGTTVNNQSDYTRPWNSYVVVSTNALSSNPVFLSNIANDPNDPIYRGWCDGRCGGMFDFLDIEVSPKDGTAWASAVDTCTGDCVTNPNAPANSMRGEAIQAVNYPILTVPPK